MDLVQKLIFIRGGGEFPVFTKHTCEHNRVLVVCDLCGFISFNDSCWRANINTMDKGSLINHLRECPNSNEIVPNNTWYYTLGQMKMKKTLDIRAKYILKNPVEIRSLLRKHK